MDWEEFATRLPEEPPAALLRWAGKSCADELGGDYTVYRCQRAAGAPEMEDLFEGRTAGRRGWATLCTCTACGEDWLTRKGGTASSFWVAQGEDGTTYPADADGIGADYIEVTENDQLLCPLCDCMTTAVRARTIGEEKNKRLQICQLANIVRAGYGNLLADQVKAYGGTPEKYERYLEKQGQGWQGLGLLRDARWFAGALHPGQALTQEEIWPARLRQTHDRLAAIRTAAITQEQRRKLQAGFDMVLRRYGGLQWTDGELEILLPRSNQELVAEGQTLRHCVGGYGAQHAAGEKIILFVRHHRRPERSYYTLNISFSGDRPEEVQLHGYGNERHGEHKEHKHRIPAKVRQFVDGWEKNILLPWFIQNMKKEKSA